MYLGFPLKIVDLKEQLKNYRGTGKKIQSQNSPLNTIIESLLFSEYLFTNRFILNYGRVIHNLNISIKQLLILDFILKARQEHIIVRVFVIIIHAMLNLVKLWKAYKRDTGSLLIEDA